MSKPGLVIILFFLSGRALSQDYFAFIGADHRQPFYVRIDSQVYSSTAAGHLLLAPLKDSDYIVTIGFPGQTYPEKRYEFRMRGKDQEFELRRQDDGNWRLYDEMSKKWVTAMENENKAELELAGVKKDDAFSRMMAGVVHDTAVLYNTFAMEAVLKDSPVIAAGPKTDSIAKMARADSSARIARADSLRADSGVSTARGVVAATSAAKNPAAGDSAAHGVVKLNEKKSSRSVRLVYKDNKDTIEVIIPRDTATVAGGSPSRVLDTARKAKVSMTGKPRVDTAMRVAADVTWKTGTDTARKVAEDVTRKASFDTAKGTTVDTARKAATGIAYINSDCHNFATDNDVDKLRVKMLQAGKDEDRIAAARKIFKTRCFYTSQIRALSELFNSDAGKFGFFQAAWPFAADEHFGELSALLSDPAYIDQFKAMTGGKP